MTTSQKNYPRSMSVSDMMKLGKLADGKESTVINVYKFDITSVTLSVVLECHSGHESTRRAFSTRHAWMDVFFTRSPPPGMRVSHASSTRRNPTRVLSRA